MCVINSADEDDIKMKKIGIIGFGRMGSYLYRKINDNPNLKVDFVYELLENKTKELDSSILVNEPMELSRREVDLVVETADFRAVKELAAEVLETTDILILSASALAEEKLEEKLKNVSDETGHKFYIPHGAILGMDGFRDAKEVFDEIEITTVKPPKNLDFTFQDEWKADEIKSRTVLYNGSTRRICKLFPRNVNSHAVLALSGLGFDKTHSTLVADPNTTLASHHIVAKGGGTLTEIIQSSPIKGVTGEFTLSSIYGTVQRILVDEHGLNIC